MAKSGEGTVTLYNLAEATKELIRDAGKRIRVSAGYQNDLVLLHDGDVLRSEQVDDRSDRKTVISCGPRSYAINQANFSKSYSGQVQTKQVVADAIHSFDGVDFNQQSLDVVPDSATVTNFCFKGKTTDLLKEVLTPLDIQWYENKNELQFSVLNKVFNESDVVVLNANTGLIKTAVQTDRGVNATSLLNPLLQVGAIVKIENDVVENASFNNTDVPKPSENTKGFYKIIQANYVGDNWDGKFEAVIQCIPYNNLAAGNSS